MKGVAVKLNLTDLQEVARKTFDYLELELGEGVVVTFLNPIRMEETQRAELAAAVEAMAALGGGGDADKDGAKGKAKKDDGEAEKRPVTKEDHIQAVRNFLRIGMQDPSQIGLLDERLGDQVDLWFAVMQSYWEAVNVGEA